MEVKAKIRKTVTKIYPSLLFLANNNLQIIRFMLQNSFYFTFFNAYRRAC